MRTLRAAELVLDFEIYPRNNVDSKNVSRIVDALSSGVELPPIIIDKKSKRVIDGFHRVKAHLRLYGDDTEVTAIEKAYRSDAEMFLDAARYNAVHGQPMDDCDRTHCIIISERLKIDATTMAGALHIPVERLGKLRTERTGIGAGGLTIPLKRTVAARFHGRRLTARQQEANSKLSGMNQAFYVNQLVELIESKMLDLDNESLMERLRVLHGLLDDVLVAK